MYQHCGNASALSYCIADNEWNFDGSTVRLSTVLFVWYACMHGVLTHTHTYTHIHAYILG